MTRPKRRNSPPRVLRRRTICESGIAINLGPGQYTALLSGLGNGTGVGVVEVYDRGAP